MEIVYFRLEPLKILAYVVSLLTSLDFIRGIELGDKLVSGKKDTDLSFLFLDILLDFISIIEESMFGFPTALGSSSN